jgi:hypothetical protein
MRPWAAFDSVAASSNAQVTVGTVFGSQTIQGFDTATDFIFYQNESIATTAAIVAAQTHLTVGGVASTQIALPDGTVMTLVGVTSVTGAMFK